MVDVYILCTQMKGISSEIIELVHVNSINFVTYYLELPISCAIRLSTDESSDSLDILRSV